MLWRLIWCSDAGCTALGRFFRVGRSCSVPDFTGFPLVVQCAGQAILCRNVGFHKNVRCVAVCEDVVLFPLGWRCLCGGVVAVCCCGLRVVGVAVQEVGWFRCCAFVSGNRCGVRCRELRWYVLRDVG